MNQFKKCSILKDTNSNYSNSSDKLRDILPFGEIDRTTNKYAHGRIMPMTEEDKARDREDIKSYMNNKGHIFSLICSCGHIMSGIITNNDIYDKLHCDCGLVWKINKPYKEIENNE